MRQVIEAAIKISNENLITYEQVELGIDVIGSAYPEQLTANGQALAFTVPPNGLGGLEVLSLHDASMRKDTRPLVLGCECHACLNHHRAYVHHLLRAHEMTGHVLLTIHNTHQMLAFFDSLRSHLKAGTLTELKRAVCDAPAL